MTKQEIKDELKTEGPEVRQIDANREKCQWAE